MAAMDSPTLIGIGIGCGIGLLFAGLMQKKKKAALAPKIEAALRAQGAMTLQALADACGHGSFMARGQVVLVLNDMAAQGTLRIIPAPDGTPQLQKVNFIKYELTG
jgi:hypothetical protein